MTAFAPHRSRFVGRSILPAVVAGGAAAIALAVVTAPMPVVINLALIAHIAGMLAGYLVALMVILMARVPVLEREIGADRLSRWHGRIGRTFVVVMLIHVFAATAVWIELRGDTVLGGIANVLALSWMPAAAVATLLFVVIAALSIRAARRNLSYESWHAVHLLTYVAVFLSFGHELAGPSLAGYPIVQVAWSLFYAYTLVLVLRYRVMKPFEHYLRHRMHVESVIVEAPGVTSIVLRGRYLAELAAQPGQFFRWRFISRSTWMSAHPFSLSAPAGPDRMRITVKDLGDGSRFLQSIRPGTRVMAEGPYGAMTARKRTRRSVLLIAGGVGITPMRALFETLEAEAGALTLIYRASSQADVVFQKELQEIAKRRGAELLWLIGRSSEPKNRLDGRRLIELVPDIRDRDVYLCASPQLSAAVRGALREVGLPRRHFHEEAFAF
jgi:predicted ferric reductase